MQQLNRSHRGLCGNVNPEVYQCQTMRVPVILLLSVTLSMSVANTYEGKVW